MKALNLSYISKYRSAVMGLAIFWIFFYHTGVDIPGLREIFALGWMGVDIFFFVSGFGLCASLSKNDSVSNFFKRRFFRIIPTWWIVLAAMAIVGTLWSLKGFPMSASDYFYWFTGLGWWTANCNFEWYIPTLLVFYLLSPLLARMSLKALCISTVASMFVAILLGGGMLHILDNVYMSYSRVPIYIFGFAVYKYQQKSVSLPSYIWLPMLAIGIIGFGAGMFVKLSNVPFGLTIARVCIPLFIIPMITVVGFVFSKIKWANAVMSFLGLISLEIYLLHINHEFSQAIQTKYLINLDGYLVKMTWFMIVVVAAWLLHTAVNRCLKQTNKK